MSNVSNRVLVGLAAGTALVVMAAGSSLAQRPGGTAERPAGQAGQAAQPRQGNFGNFGNFGGSVPPVVKAAADGVYVLNNGLLTKFDTDLKEKGKVRLIDAPAAPGAADAARQMPSRPAPGAMLIAANSKVVVVIGDQLFSVDAELSQAPAKVSLPSMQAPPAAAPSGGASDAGQAMRMQFAPPPQVPVLEAQGNIVYVVRGIEIVAVDLVQNKVLGLASLPQSGPARPADN